MIEVKTGDILTLTEGILVHGCNCGGVMGGGIAKLIRDQWNDVYQAYLQHCRFVGLRLGDIVSVGGSHFDNDKKHQYQLNTFSYQLPPDLIVVNAMTQYYYGRDADTVYVDYDAVAACFARINLIARHGLTVNFPLIGCGLANGKWEEVAKAIESVMIKDVKLVLWKLPE